MTLKVISSWMSHWP